MKFLATYEDVTPSRTPAPRTKMIEAENLDAAYKEAYKDSEYAWGFQNLVSVVPAD